MSDIGQSTETKPATERTGRAFAFALVLLAGVSLAWMIEWLVGRTMAASRPLEPRRGSPVKAGPWVTCIACLSPSPHRMKILPVRKLEANGTHWLFKNFSRTTWLHSFKPHRCLINCARPCSTRRASRFNPTGSTCRRGLKPWCRSRRIHEWKSTNALRGIRKTIPNFIFLHKAHCRRALRGAVSR